MGRAATPVSMGYLAFRDGDGRLRVGVRPLDPCCWLEVDDAREQQLELKQKVLDAIVEDLRLNHAIEVTPDPLHPIDAAGRLVQEDLCLHLVRDGTLVLAA